MSDVLDDTTTTDPRGLIFITPEAFADMEGWHATAAELRREAPILRVEAEGWQPFWAVTRHADVLEVSRRSDLFWNTEKSAPGPDLQYDMMQALGVELPRTLVHLHGDVHNKLRQVTNDWFKPAAVKHLQPAIDRIADEYVEKMAEMGGRCDFAADVAVPFTIRVIMSIFGVPQSDEPLMLQLTQGLFGAADPEYLGDFSDPMQLITSTIGTFEQYFGDLTVQRQQEPTDDLATVIANGLVDGEPMGERERLWYYIIVATAGHDTTSFALAGGLQALLEHPEQWEALRGHGADDEVINRAADEMIRWTTPVRHFLRHTDTATTIQGVDIPAGGRVLLSYPSANRDEAVFVDPMRFDVGRSDADRLLSFGVGAHFCLGAQFARREVRSFLRRLVDQVDVIEPDGPAQWSQSHFVSGVKHLPIRYRFR